MLLVVVMQVVMQVVELVGVVYTRAIVEQEVGREGVGWGVGVLVTAVAGAQLLPTCRKMRRG